MRLRRFFYLLATLSLLASPVIGGQLSVGDEAPDFKMAGSDGKVYTLKQFVGKKPVVIAWFPKAFTGG
jgi:peroxiredoxin Q/BCP